MSSYYVEKTFTFQVEPGLNYSLIWTNICHCLREELGEEYDIPVFEKSSFDITAEKGLVHVINSGDKLIAICESSLINIDIGFSPGGSSTFWVGQILRRDDEGNPVEVSQEDQKASSEGIEDYSLLGFLTMTRAEVINGGEFTVRKFKFNDKKSNSLKPYGRGPLKIQIPKGFNKEFNKEFYEDGYIKCLRIDGEGITDPSNGIKGNLYVFPSLPGPFGNHNYVKNFLGYVVGGFLVFTGIFPASSDLIRILMGLAPIDFTTLDPTYPYRLLGGVLLIFVLQRLPKRIKNKKD